MEGDAPRSWIRIHGRETYRQSRRKINGPRSGPKDGPQERRYLPSKWMT